MFPLKQCRVGILRPPDIEAGRYCQHEIDVANGEADVGEELWRERLDQIIETIRDMIDHAAKELKMQVAITSYQLHQHAETVVVMGRRRAREVQTNEILVTLNPPPSVHRFATAVGNHPLRRTIVALTSKDVLTDILRLLAAQRLPVFDAEHPDRVHALQRVFALHFPPNPDDAAAQYEQGKRIVSHALRYPQIAVRPSDGNFFSVEKVDAGDRESQPEFRQYFVEEEGN